MLTATAKPTFVSILTSAQDESSLETRAQLSSGRIVLDNHDPARRNAVRDERTHAAER